MLRNTGMYLFVVSDDAIMDHDKLLIDSGPLRVGIDGRRCAVSGPPCMSDPHMTLSNIIHLQF